MTVCVFGHHTINRKTTNACIVGTYEGKYFMSGSQWVKLSDGKRPEHGTSSVCYIGTKPTPSGVSRTCGWRSRRLLALTAAQPIVAVLECRSERYGVAR